MVEIVHIFSKENAPLDDLYEAIVQAFSTESSLPVVAFKALCEIVKHSLSKFSFHESGSFSSLSLSLKRLAYLVNIGKGSLTLEIRESMFASTMECLTVFSGKIISILEGQFLSRKDEVLAVLKSYQHSTRSLQV